MSSMQIVQLNPEIHDSERRAALFRGEFLLYSCTPMTGALVNHAKKFIRDAFSNTSPQKAQYDMSVEQFIAKAAKLKTKFTNALETKEIIRDVLAEYGCDLGKTFFDVPRLRVVTSDGFLTAGVGYAYKAHRDIWYSSPTAQLNWWLPVYDLTSDQTMSMYPEYWAQSIRNSSIQFDYDEWRNVGRGMATMQGLVDTRKHPVPLEEVRVASETRFVLRAGESMVFSAAHLHATSPNTSGQTRFSMDFRTVHLDDLASNQGSPNVDSLATGTTLGDFLRASDFLPLSEEIIKQYQQREA